MKYDVIVVGAGPAGSQCAKRLAQAGLRVMVYDRRQEIGAPKRCGEVIDVDIEQCIGKVPENCIRQRIRGARLYIPDGRHFDIATKVTGYMVERKVFDKWLAVEAVKAGAHLQSATLITDLMKDGDKVIGVKGEFLGEKFEEQANVVVIATGAESRLARQTGIDTSCRLSHIGACLQYEMAGTKVEPGKIHIVIGNNVAPRGYAWIFSKGDTANVGIGIAPGDKPAKYYLDRFIEGRPELEGASIIEVNAGIVPIGGFLKDMVADGAVIIGEAALQVNPLHGGGIREAVIAGSMAAEVIVEADKKGDFSKKALSAYNRRWWKERGDHLSRLEKVVEIYESMDEKDITDLANSIRQEDVDEIVAGGKLKALARVFIKKPRLFKIIAHLV